MAKVWDMLNLEYGASEDLVNKAVNSLMQFTFSTFPKTEPEKFHKLY